MLKLILLSFLVFSTAAVGASVRELYYQADNLAPNNIGPTFVNGYLVVYGPNKSVSVYSPDGTFAYSISPEHGFIHNATVDTDQTSAVAIQFGGKRGMISIFDRTGSPIRAIETGTYLPSFVCFAPDHSIWVTGRQWRQSLTDKPEYFILRHFSRDGNELGAFLPRSSLEEDDSADPVMSIVGLPGLQAASNRIGALLNYGGKEKAMWVETDLNGKEIGRWRVNINGHPSVFTQNGAVYARVVGGISTLDHVTGKWNRVLVPAESGLVGSDGESLLFITPGSTALRSVSVNP